MEIDPANLPEGTQAIQVLVRQRLATVGNQGSKVDRLEARLTELNRLQFGRSLEKIACETE